MPVNTTAEKSAKWVHDEDCGVHGPRGLRNCGRVANGGKPGPALPVTHCLECDDAPHIRFRRIQARTNSISQTVLAAQEHDTPRQFQTTLSVRHHVAAGDPCGDVEREDAQWSRKSF